MTHQASLATLAESHDFKELELSAQIISELSTHDSELEETDFSITYYVAGSRARAIVRSNNCSSCKDILVAEEPAENCDLVSLVSRKSLFHPSVFCFFVARKCYEIFSTILFSDCSRESFFRRKTNVNCFCMS